MIFLTDIVGVDLTTSVKFSLIEGETTLASCSATDWEQPGCWLMQVHTHPDHRRQGHGRRLLQQVLDYAQKAKKTGVGLAVRKDNKPAQALYQSLGFVTCYVHGRDLVMTKHLQPLADPSPTPFYPLWLLTAAWRERSEREYNDGNGTDADLLIHQANEVDRTVDMVKTMLWPFLGYAVPTGADPGKPGQGWSAKLHAEELLAGLSRQLQVHAAQFIVRAVSAQNREHLLEALHQEGKSDEEVQWLLLARIAHGLGEDLLAKKEEWMQEHHNLRQEREGGQGNGKGRNQKAGAGRAPGGRRRQRPAVQRRRAGEDCPGLRGQVPQLGRPHGHRGNH